MFSGRNATPAVVHTLWFWLRVNPSVVCEILGQQYLSWVLYDLFLRQGRRLMLWASVADFRYHLHLILAGWVSQSCHDFSRHLTRLLPLVSITVSLKSCIVVFVQHLHEYVLWLLLFRALRLGRIVLVFGETHLLVMGRSSRASAETWRRFQPRWFFLSTRIEWIICLIGRIEVRLLPGFIGLDYTDCGAERGFVHSDILALSNQYAGLRTVIENTVILHGRMCMYGSLVVVLFRCLLILHLQREIALFVSINLDRLSGLLLRLSRLDNVVHIIVLAKAAGFRMGHGQDSLGSFILTTQWNIWMIMQDVNKFLCNISFEGLHLFKLFNRNLPFLIDRILCFLCLLGTATVLFTYAKAA